MKDRLKEIREKYGILKKEKLVILDAALSLISYKNNRQKNNIINLKNALIRSTEVKDMKKTYHKFLSALDNAFSANKFLYGMIESSSARKAIENSCRKYNVDTYDISSSYEYDLANDPYAVAKKAASDYIDLVRCENVDLEEENSRIKDEENRKKDVRAVNTEMPQHDFHEVPYPENTRRVDRVARKGVTLDYDGDIPLQILNAVEEEINRYLESNTTMDFELSEELRNTIKSLSRRGVLNEEIADYQISRYLDLIELSYRVQIQEKKFAYSGKLLSRNKKPLDLKDLHELAYEISLALPKELLSSNLHGTGDAVKTISRLKMRAKTGSLLDSYANAYAAFMKRYDKLTDIEKEKIKNDFMDNLGNGYVNPLHYNSFNIVTPDELKKCVNNKVKDMILEKYYLYYAIDDYGIDRSEIVPTLKKATSYMEIDEICFLYYGIKNKKIDMERFTYDDSEKESILKTQEKQNVALQLNFIYVIISRLSENEKKMFDGKENELLIYVCDKYLHEKPKFETNFSYSLNEEDAPEFEKEDIDIAYNSALSRFYGMPKMQKVAARMSGTYGKLLKLYESAKFLKNSTREN